MKKFSKKQINTFLATLSQEHSKQIKGFSVVCRKCGSSNVTIFHGCDYYYYSSYTNGFDEKCGLKCKDCGNAANIESTGDA